MSKSANIPKEILGRVELVQLVDHGQQFIPAKVDTGADISSISVSNIREDVDTLSFVLFDASSPHYTGAVMTLPKKDYRLTRIANSFGAKEQRYVVKLRTRLNGRIIRVSFSLANRSQKVYPILLGRRLLKDKFLVDVAKGTPLDKQEAAIRKKLHIELGLDKG